MLHFNITLTTDIVTRINTIQSTYYNHKKEYITSNKIEIRLTNTHKI